MHLWVFQTSEDKETESRELERFPKAEDWIYFRDCTHFYFFPDGPHRTLDFPSGEECC